MNESEFINLWDTERQSYQAWGDFVQLSIAEELHARGKDLNSFLKLPASTRLKDTSSLVDKAFYRNKNYDDPYNQIEDKVGVRFVVLVLEGIDEICEIVESSKEWVFNASRHFEDDKKTDPLLFTYQSVHYVLRPTEDRELGGVHVPSSTPCELQVRTLLQHAHAELTHDAIYKAKKTVKPEIHRTVAKSMALIETTDEFFSQVTTQLEHGPLQEHQIVERLDNLYFSLTQMTAVPQKSSIIIWEVYEPLVDKNLVDAIQHFFEQATYDSIPERIRSRYVDHPSYQQSIVLFIYWMLSERKARLLQDWPFNIDVLRPFANDLGISIF